MSFYFIQMADPQFGMFSALSELTDGEIADRRSRGLIVRKATEKIVGFADETRLYTAAIEGANKLIPAFVVVCGDMTHNSDDQSQLDEIFRITALLDSGIPFYWVAGNHDVGEAPTSESLAIYREHFGKDNFSFDHGGCHFTVINSSVCYDPSNVPEEWQAIVQFLRDDLSTARRNGCDEIILLAHHPLFIDHPDEDDGYFVVPRERRRAIMEVLREYDVGAVFAGHMHRNAYATDGRLQMVTTGAVGYPLGDDPSGLRIVKVGGDAITHEYFAMDRLPSSVEL